MGEHHSAGYEIIASPEVFIGVAAERTKHIKLGTGVSLAPLPPPVAAGRPDGAARPPHAWPHDARGRSRPAHVRRAHARHPRRRAAPAHGGVTRRDHGAAARRDRHAWRRDGFILRDARLQLAPVHRSVLRHRGRRVLLPDRRARGRASTASACCRSRRRRSRAWTCSATTGTCGRRSRSSTVTSPTASKWRLVGPMHLAETREQAEKEVEYGIAEFSRYFTHVLPAGPVQGDTARGDHREQQGAGLRGHRHARRRDRPDRGARRGEQRRVRRRSCSSATTGRPRPRSSGRLRAVRAVRDAEVPGPARPAGRIVRLGHRQRRRVRRPGRQRDRQGDRGSRRRAQRRSSSPRRRRPPTRRPRPGSRGAAPSATARRRRRTRSSRPRGHPAARRDPRRPRGSAGLQDVLVTRHPGSRAGDVHRLIREDELDERGVGEDRVPGAGDAGPAVQGRPSGVRHRDPVRPFPDLGHRVEVAGLEGRVVGRVGRFDGGFRSGHG